ncbi:MAG: hypothetical protein JST15_00545 [Bacteroidetes bacterium]|nr:hypothetical protein [Bacteroidota bacterium]
MKTNINKLILFIVFLFIFSNNCYSWNSRLLSISTNQCYPSSFETNNDFFVFNVSVEMYNVYIWETDRYEATFYLIQNDITTTIGTYQFENHLGIATFSINVNPNHPLCWNLNAKLKCVVREWNNASSSTETNYGYFRVYKESGGGVISGQCQTDLKAIVTFDND